MDQFSFNQGCRCLILTDLLKIRPSGATWPCQVVVCRTLDEAEELQSELKAASICFDDFKIHWIHVDCL